ncbi:NADPH oxidase 5-like [Lingula anatina]|uniref:NADPH oxidase 5-like n=1 Tax=Lingula anatina TaxID=7574 RepID=A0A1S3J7S1_LINAN|nr:NADPH oxidase 5-like [Lingula anatina]|eukprot:XP_013406457.1 NADPH oxidase 5-like [Lingula anatina]
MEDILAEARKQHASHAGEDGEVDLETFRTCVAFCEPMYADRLFKILDKDGSAGLSLQEWEEGVRRVYSEKEIERLQILFDVFVTEGEGAIDTSAVKAILIEALGGEDHTFSEEYVDSLVQLLIEEAAKDLEDEEDCRLDFEEFEELMNKFPALSTHLVKSTTGWFRNIIKAGSKTTLPRPKESSRTRSCCPNCQTTELLNRSPSGVAIFLYFSVSAGLIAERVLRFLANNSEITGFDILARVCGQLLNLNCMLVVVLMLRVTLTLIRSSKVAFWLPIDQHIDFHKAVGVVILILSILHTGGHIGNFIMVAPSMNITVAEALFTTKSQVGWVAGTACPTGWALLVLIIIMFIGAQSFVRRRGHFELFYFSHILYAPTLILLVIHGPSFWKWFVAPGAIFVVEKLYRFKWIRRLAYGRTFVQEGILLPSKVTHLVLDRPESFSFNPGDYVFINIPKIAKFEWHPFTISSAPEYRGHIWLHIRAVGTWTTKVNEYFDEKRKRWEATMPTLKSRRLAVSNFQFSPAELMIQERRMSHQIDAFRSSIRSKVSASGSSLRSMRSRANTGGSSMRSISRRLHGHDVGAEENALSNHLLERERRMNHFNRVSNGGLNSTSGHAHEGHINIAFEIENDGAGNEKESVPMAEQNLQQGSNLLSVSRIDDILEEDEDSKSLVMGQSDSQDISTVEPYLNSKERKPSDNLNILNTQKKQHTADLDLCNVSLEDKLDIENNKIGDNTGETTNVTAANNGGEDSECKNSENSHMDHGNEDVATSDESYKRENSDSGNVSDDKESRTSMEKYKPSDGSTKEDKSEKSENSDKSEDEEDDILPPDFKPPPLRRLGTSNSMTGHNRNRRMTLCQRRLSTWEAVSSGQNFAMTKQKPFIYNIDPAADTTLNELLEVFIDGPYGSPSSHIFQAEHAVLVAGGIGVTPFASILQSILLRYQREKNVCPKCNHAWLDELPCTLYNLKKVDFFWLCRDQSSFEWFVSLLAQLEMEQEDLDNLDDSIIDFHIYMTAAKTDMRSVLQQITFDLNHQVEARDAITGLRTKTQPGRPNWDEEFQKLKNLKKGRVTIFYCGPPGLAVVLGKKAAEYGFGFRKESF